MAPSTAASGETTIPVHHLYAEAFADKLPDGVRLRLEIANRQASRCWI